MLHNAKVLFVALSFWLGSFTRSIQTGTAAEIASDSISPDHTLIRNPAPIPPFHECGTVLTPQSAAAAAKLQAAGTYNLPQGINLGTYTVPLTFHVVRRSDGTEGIAPMQLDQALNDANAAYASLGIQFSVPGAIDYIDNDAYYFDIDTIAEIDALRTTNVVANTINCYFTPNLAYEYGTLCGISSFTFMCVQGVVMANGCTGISTDPTNHSTFPHELGHYFDLFHTHEDCRDEANVPHCVECVARTNCTDDGDRLCDTPADPNLKQGQMYLVDENCTYIGSIASPCAGDPPYVPLTYNYMSYSRHHCRTDFTAEQRTRALATLLNLRCNLLGGNCPPMVSNVTAEQRTDGSKIVDIFYDLANSSTTIGVVASDDNGQTWIAPIATVSGDLGPGITIGACKHIVWNSFTDLPGIIGSQFKVRVCASDPTIPSGMALIPAGEFVMGDHHDGMPWALPLHAVYIDAFYMDKFEVTNQQYADALNWANSQGGLITVSNGDVYKFSSTNTPYCSTTSSSCNSCSRITWNGIAFGVVPGKESHPMEIVTWYGSAAYANWRNGMEDRSLSYDTTTWACDFAAAGYRLPTEAEWEKAGRGDNYNHYYRYPWGDSLDGSNANYWASGDPYETGPWPWTTPVGYYNGSQTPPGVDMANGYGLNDMAGNVSEWCNDWWSDTYYAEVTPYIANPHGPLTGNRRIVRGGNWFGFGDAFDSYYLLSAWRENEGEGGYPGEPYYGNGFRLALNSEGGSAGAESTGSSCGDSADFAIDNAPFGDVNGSGGVNLDDILCILSSFGGNTSCASGLSNADIVPCGGDGLINLDDILAILQAFAGADLCP